MPKPPKNWPPGLEPARMDAECAAYFVGVSKTTFLEGISIGRYPNPVREGGRVLWITRSLRESVEKKSQSLNVPTAKDWLEKLDADSR